MEFTDYYSGEAILSGDIKAYEPLYTETEADLVAMFKCEQLKVAQERNLSAKERLERKRAKERERNRVKRAKKREELKEKGLYRKSGRPRVDLSTLSVEERKQLKARRRYFKNYRAKKRKELKENGLYFGKGRHTKEQNAYLAELLEQNKAENLNAIFAKNHAAEQKFLKATAAKQAAQAAAEKIRENLA